MEHTLVLRATRRRSASAHAGHARATLDYIHDHRHHPLPGPLADFNLAQNSIDTMASGDMDLLR